MFFQKLKAERIKCCSKGFFDLDCFYQGPTTSIFTPLAFGTSQSEKSANFYQYWANPTKTFRVLIWFLLLFFFLSHALFRPFPTKNPQLKKWM